MTDSSATIAVVGDGLAAHTAGRQLRNAGHRVVLVRRGSGGTADLWGGLGFAFGPASEPLPDSTGAVDARQHSERSFVAQRRRRWDRLMTRRGSFHPYRRLELDFDDVQQTLERVVHSFEALPLTECRDGRVVAGPLGSPAAPDVVAESIAPFEFDRDERVGILEPPTVSGWWPGELRRQLERIDSLQTELLRPPSWTELPGGHPVKAAKGLEQHLKADSTAVLDDLTAAVDDADIDFLVIPPCLGATASTHRSILAKLRSSLDIQFAEMPASTDAIFGWRNARELRDQERRFDDVVEARASALRSDDGGRVSTLVTESGRELEADAFVVATGRWIDGGLPGSAPFVEPLTQAPLWLDGGPLPGHTNAFPADFLDKRPWDDHPLFRAGLAVDPRGRPLDVDGRPQFSNVHAVGRLLGGFNPAHDDCAMGVDLVCARIVAERLDTALSSSSTSRS